MMGMMMMVRILSIMIIDIVTMLMTHIKTITMATMIMPMMTLYHDCNGEDDNDNDTGHVVSSLANTC